MKQTTCEIFETLLVRYSALTSCREQIRRAFDVLAETYRNGGKVLCCGNGGSAADCEHIVGELLKKFKKHRAVPVALKTRLAAEGEIGLRLADQLEGSLPAISLVSQSGILTAFANDVGWEAAFAQQLYGLGRAGDCLITLSTSGNSTNCVAAAVLARALGIRTIALTGIAGGRLAETSDVAIRAPAPETYQVQEFHLPIYHALCAMLEEELFN